MKKLLIFLTLIVCVSFSATLCLTACKDNQQEPVEVKLVGFDDVTVFADLDKDFSVGCFMMAVDENGNTYKGKVTVTDYNGEEVLLQYNRFNVTTLNPYKVTVEVELPNGEIKTKIVTVDAKDSSFPLYTFSFELITGTVGSEYTLPTATATKGIGEVMDAEIKVYSEKTGIAVTVENGKFTPQVEGKYNLLAEVTDYYGDIYIKKIDFTVRPKMSSELALEDFDNKNSIDNLNRRERFDSSTKSTWMAEKKDNLNVSANGVAYTEIYKDNKCVAARLNKTEAELFDVIDWLDTISARVMVSPTVSATTFKLKFFNVNKTIEIGKWTEISLNRNELLANLPGNDTYEKIESFAKAYNKTASGKASNGMYIFSTNVFYNESDFKVENLPLYVDSISFTKSEIANSQIVVENFDRPNVGEEFTLPTAKIIGDNGETLVSDYTLDVKNNGKEIKITEESGIKKINVYSGITVFKYSFNYKSKDYYKSISVNIGERAEMLSNMLEDFNDGLSANNLTFDAVFQERNYSTWTEYESDKDGLEESGVVNVIISSDQVAAGRFNKTKEELITIMDKLDTLTTRIMVKKDGSSTYKFKLFGIEKTGNEIGKWVDVTVTKAEILAKMSGATNEEKIENFAKAYCYSGNGQAKGGVCIYWIPNGAGMQLYVDSVSFTQAEIGDSQIILGSYTAPTEAGGTFTLPTAKIVDENGATLISEYAITAQSNNQTISVIEENGDKKIYLYSGETVVKFNLEYHSKFYSKTITFNFENRGAMASNMLEDFDDSLSTKNLTKNALFPSSENALWLESKGDSDGVKQYGVVTVNSYTGNKCAAGRFNKTEAELIEIMDSLETLSVRLMVTKDASTNYTFKLFGINKTITVGKWNTITVTKTEILNQMSGTTNEEKIADFAKAYNSSGRGYSTNNYRIYGTPNITVDMPIYIDEISFSSLNN